MKKTILLLIALVSLSFYTKINAQTNVTGTVYDQNTNESIGFASVRVLNSLDSTYVAGAASDEDGKFSIRLNERPYIMQISFLGYANKYLNINPKLKNNLGDIFLPEDGISLAEATVTAKAVEIQIKGDTIEYNADSYKVQESAVVEDLLKKMPGVEVSEDGKITVNGKEIKKILVDGKEFFSDDPKVASKNLPASMVDKLQVLDKRSEMAEMTGFDDDDEETVINLTVKKGMKQGVFGNAYAGYGNKDRYESNAVVNYMRNNTQVTGLAGTNNTNNASFSDFASSTTGAGGPPRGVSFGGRNGITKSINGGFNIATETSEKFKWNGDLQYGSTDNDVESTKNTQYTTSDERISKSISFGNNNSKNIGSNLRFEWQPDSLTRIIFRPNIRYGRNINFSESSEDLFLPHDENGGYSSESRNGSNGKTLGLNGDLQLSRKLNNAGRTLSLQFSGGMSEGDSRGESWFDRVYNDPARPDSILDQRFVQDDKNHNLRAHLSYVEPLGKNNFLQLTYNVRLSKSETDKIAYDGVNGIYDDINSDYTRKVENKFLNQNVSLSFRSVRQKFNYTIGLGLEPSSSKTKIEQPSLADLSVPKKTSLNIAPNLTFNYLWDKRHNLRISYRGRTTEPSTLQLFDGITSNDGSSTTRGNPYLKASFSNNLMIRYQKFNPLNSSVFMIFGRFNQTMNDIVRITNWNEDEGRDITYKNVNGNMSGNMRVVYNTPLKNKKFSFNSMTFGSYNRSNTFIGERNAEPSKNRASIYTIQENMGIQFRSDKFDFNLRGNITYEDLKNSNGKNNQSTYRYGGFASTTAYLPYDFSIDTDLNYSSNSGYSSGFKQDEWLWNASISKQIFKNKAGTIRVKMYDILKKQSNISRSNNVDYIQDTTTNSLNSYFMVNFAYKFQIFSGGAKVGDMQAPERRGGGRGHF